MTDVIQTIDQYSIARRCLLVSLTISAWSGRKFDRAASTAVEQENSTAEGRARVNKLLVRPEVLLPVNRAANALRNAVYEGTLPWADNSTCTRARIRPYSEKMGRRASADLA